MIRLFLLLPLALSLPLPAWAVQLDAHTGSSATEFPTGDPDPGRFEFRQRHMGVIARLVFYAPDSVLAHQAASAAFRRIAELDAVLSDYLETSEVNRVMADPVGEPVAVGADLFRVLEVSQRLAELSDGAFDVTAGPLIRLWREARAAGRLPSPDELSAARERIGWRYLHLDPTRRTVTLARHGMALDFGGIGKGYAADEALSELARHGIERALVEMGGEIAAGAPPPGRDGWLIELGDAPRGDVVVIAVGVEVDTTFSGVEPRRSLSLSHAAISTSGDTEQFMELDGVRYSHVVDPRTGVALTHGINVHVLAPTATLADGLSTLVSVTGEAAGRALVSDPRFEEFVAGFDLRPR